MLYTELRMIDSKFAVARRWSNEELKKFAHLYTRSVVNVSAWRDEDKEGGHYREYFTNASEYSLTNFETDAMGYQGYDDEIFLDLTAPLDPALEQKFDVVFNHTTLEHVYKVHNAWENLCKLSSDTVIVVVPFLQQMHAEYGDFWRFTPLAVKNMFAEHGFETVYLSYNNQRHAAVYVFAIASRKPENWKHITKPFSYLAKTDPLDMFPPYIGCRAVTNSLWYRICNYPWRRLLQGKARKPEQPEEAGRAE